MNTDTKNKWDEAGEKAWQAIYTAVKAMREPPSGEKGMTLDAIAEKVGAGNKSTIAGWIKEERGGKDIAFPDMFRYLENLGFNIHDFLPTPTIRRLGPLSPKVNAEAGETATVNVYALAGAGPAHELIESEPICSIKAPVSFAASADYALKVDGESMYPTIKKGAVVGVSSDKQFRQNEIFAVNIPYEGVTIKRVSIDHVHGEYVLRSDNPDKEKYSDFRIVVSEVPNLLAGRVVWVWQGV